MWSLDLWIDVNTIYLHAPITFIVSAYLLITISLGLLSFFQMS